MKKHTYVLGTGLSHDGSACLLKDGKIAVAIEKERVTRIKHDGGNDSDAINYCLNAEGISIHDVDLIVQNTVFGNFKFGNDYVNGLRPFNDSMDIPVVTISHHLAHAYSTIGTCPFDEFNMLVMDGCGNSFQDCMDLEGAYIPDLHKMGEYPHLFHEKDSFYGYKDGQCTPLLKDFSEWGYGYSSYPMHSMNIKHSIGGFYGAVSVYCFGNMDDPGKLMGLGPYGRPGVFKEQLFELKDGRVFLNYDWMDKYRKPARSYFDFKKNFQYYADIAYGVQREVEKAILYIVKSRVERYPTENLCYSGGTALNAVANAKILAKTDIRNIYIEPAAADNGLSLGCAFYGWLEVLKKEKVGHDGSTCFGIQYPREKIRERIDLYKAYENPESRKKAVSFFFEQLNKEGNTMPGSEANIRFNIEDYGVSHLVINGSLQYENKVIDNPTCIISAKESDLLHCLLYPQQLMNLLGSGKISVTNLRDLELLLANIDIDHISSSIWTSLTVQSEASDKGFKFKETGDFIKETAALLADGKIIGWFQDGCEFGPRALGRRSILADPRNLDVRNFINTHIKFREDFRPFAPSVLREDVSIYFDTERESPYMILVDKVREDYKDKIRSVVHEDGTCRVQTVTPDWSPKFYALLQEFKKLTGLSVLLNTSFNRRGMPIVETPEDALSFFFSCQLDYLVMDRFIISK